MKKIFSTEDSMIAGFIKTMLEQEGIPCLMKNQNLAGAMGEIPINECWPEIWITEDDDYARAAGLVNTFLSATPTRNSNWLCTCGESIEGQFTACWSCGKQRPD